MHRPAAEKLKVELTAMVDGVSVVLQTTQDVKGELEITASTVREGVTVCVTKLPGCADQTY